LPPALQFLILDYTLWLWHRANHEAPFLWRFHAAHHADPDLDLSTAIRFHAGEMALSVPLRVLQARCLGVAPDVLLAWEAATMAAILFHHSNLRLPRALDAAARAVFVTPRLHGIHHSIVDEDRAHNFGTVFTFWDRLHGRYLAGTPNRRLVIGIPELPERPALSAAASLAFPFRRAT
jgi:sterol desaturase/sphingolipid hydroxylase (fatty acid hydroxylase superfamily)